LPQEIRNDHRRPRGRRRARPWRGRHAVPGGRVPPEPR